MSLNDDERKTMVGLQMEKANRFMDQAEMVSNHSHGDRCLGIPRCLSLRLLAIFETLILFYIPKTVCIFALYLNF